MTLEQLYEDIETKLLEFENEKIVKIFNRMYPEEMLDSIDNDDFKEEIVQSIIEKIEDDEIASVKFYNKLFHEKITIDAEENYLEEEYE